MHKWIHLLTLASLLVVGVVLPAPPAIGQVGAPALQLCQSLAFSTEEDFVTQGPIPSDGNRVISDGDLLGPNCAICARNWELLQRFQVTVDLGLDAADVLDAERYLVAFSTELDSPNRGQFTAGDLLVTNGAVIPNIALLYRFNIPRADLGLDAVHFIGDPAEIIRFLTYVQQVSRDEWLREPGKLWELLTEYGLDIWFSTEGTAPRPEAPLFLDGDVLSARYGNIVASNDMLLPASVPAGIPTRGVDFGLDALTADRTGDRKLIHFSTEILFEGRPAFTDGDILLLGNGVVRTNEDLLLPCEPRAAFLGLDALFVAARQLQAAGKDAALGSEPDAPVARGEPAGAPVQLTVPCAGLVFSTEEDFVTQGPEPPDGNPIISDGDLLGANCVVCARNRELLQAFQVTLDLGLDGADVINPDSRLVAFSTELDSPNATQFTAGDLLATNGAAIPNIALTYRFQVGYDVGLDGIQFIGPPDRIATLLAEAARLGRSFYVERPEAFVASLREAGLDLWFSTEGTVRRAGAPGFLDGDLLSAATGSIVASNDLLLPASIPAGIPDRGVDFGLDAVANDRSEGRGSIHFSTEILYNGRVSFTDGDVLLINNGVVHTNRDLIQPCEPSASFLGLDAFSLGLGPCQPSIQVDKKVLDPRTGAWVEQIEAQRSTRVKFRCRITNTGQCCTLRDLVIQDILGAPLEYVDNATVDGVPHEPDTVSGNELTWLLPGPLEPGQSLNIEFEAHVKDCGRAENVQRVTAVCEDGQAVSASDNAYVTAVGKPDLVISSIVCDRANNRLGYVVENVGCQVAPQPHYTGLWVAGEQVCRDQVTVDLAPGASHEGWFDCYDWAWCTMLDDVKVCADIGGISPDQVSDVDTGTSSGCGTAPSVRSLYQSFTPSAEPLAAVELRLRAGGAFPAAGTNTTIKIRSGAYNGAVLATSTAFVPGPLATTTQAVNFAISPALGMTPGQAYVIEWLSGQVGDPVLTWMIADNNPYPRGEAFGCSGARLSGQDFIFTTYAGAAGRVDESNEDNNCREGACISAAREWTWNTTSTMPDYNQVMMAPVVADLDADSIPDIVFTTFKGSNYTSDGILRAIRGSDGAELFSITDPDYRVEPGGDPAVADIDNDGRPEIIANKDPEGIICFEHDGAFKWLSPTPSLGGGGVAIADLDEDGRPEIIAGKTVLNNNGSVRWTGSAGSSSHAAVANLDMSGHPEVLCGNSVYRHDGTIFWTGTHGGVPAVANFDRDAFPEVVIVGGDRISMWEHDGTLKWGPVPVPTTGNGPPVIADFDGDGVPEIGVGGYDAYVVFENNLTVKWIADIRDHSSRAASSTAFDFDLDGAFEIVYSDELFHRIFRGSDGAVLFQVPGPSGTLTEQPAIADIDNDGHVELVFAVNNYAFAGNTGIEVWGNDRCWPPARPIWNQHTYHITNIRDDAKVPQVEDDNWETHNNYRTQAPPVLVERKPDLVITKVLCDRANNRVGYVVRNIGDAPAPAGHDTALYVGGTFACTDEVSVNLAPGDAHTAWFDCYTWPSQPCDTITVNVCADRGNEVDEKDETNNCTTDRCSCNRVYFEPQDSGTSYCNRTPVDIRVQATNFKAGQIKLKYDPTCADAVNWVPATDFPLASWDSSVAGEEWITFSALASKSGDYKVGTLYIHCVSEANCMTVLDFIVDGAGTSKLFDEGGVELSATWEDGTFSCTRGKCGDVAPYPGCNNIIDMGDVALLHSYVGHPGQYNLCCEPCGDVAPVPQCNGVIDMGDVALLHSYVGHPGQYNLCCEPSTAQVETLPVLTAQSDVTLVPVASTAPYGATAQVQIRVNGSNFKAGQIMLAYLPSCADVVDWVGNNTDFPLTSTDSTTAGQEWITFSAMSALTGDYLIGTLTIRCESQASCSTALDFVESGTQPCKLFDDWGAEIAATWHDGTFSCGEAANKVYLPVIMKNAQP